MYTYQRQWLRKQEMCISREDKQEWEGGREGGGGGGTRK